MKNRPKKATTAHQPRPQLQPQQVDLFSGTGGAFTFAFQQTANIYCICKWHGGLFKTNLWWKFWTHLQKNLNEIQVEDIPAHDILTGGFPCQPFSIYCRTSRGVQWWTFKCILENSFNYWLSSTKMYHIGKCEKFGFTRWTKRTFTTIKNNLENRGYYLHCKVLNTSEITGIPQNRERIYIVCFKSKEISDKFNLEFSRVEKRKIQDFLEPDVHSKYYYTEKSTTWELIKNSVVKKDTVYQYRRVYVRENKSCECPTLTANMGSGGHNVPIILDDKGIRKLTPHEVLIYRDFQIHINFPIKMCDSNLYKLAGNAVSVPVIQLIANRIISLFNEK